MLIHLRALRPLALAASVIFSLLASTPSRAADYRSAPYASADKEDDYKRVTVDLGGSSNFSNGSEAYEAHLGVNLFLTRWLVWRNAPFFRSRTNVKSSYGLDSSIAGHQEITLAPDTRANASLGGGYRIISESGASAPFVELGAGANVQRLGAKLSIKRIFHSVATQGMENETLYSLDFIGAASF